MLGGYMREILFIISVILMSTLSCKTQEQRDAKIKFAKADSLYTEFKELVAHLENDAICEISNTKPELIKSQYYTLIQLFELEKAYNKLEPDGSHVEDFKKMWADPKLQLISSEITYISIKEEFIKLISQEVEVRYMIEKGDDVIARYNKVLNLLKGYHKIKNLEKHYRRQPSSGTRDKEISSFLAHPMWIYVYSNLEQKVRIPWRRKKALDNRGQVNPIQFLQEDRENFSGIDKP